MFETTYNSVCTMEGLEGRTMMSAAPVLGSAAPAGIGSAVAALVVAPSPIVYARDFGAKGDAITDDAAAIQAAIDAAPDGGTVMLAPRTYRLGQGLMITRSVTLNGRGATLLLATSSYPSNTQICVSSTFATTVYTWHEAVKAGQTKLNVAIPTTSLRAGDQIFLELGQDPHDPNQQHFARLCTVVRNTGKSVTIDVAVPFAINQGARSHSIRKVTKLAHDVAIKNLNFDHVEGTIPNANVWVEAATDVSLDNVGGRMVILCNVSNSQRVSISHVRGTLVTPHGAAGRVLTTWQSEDVTLSDVEVTTAADRAVVFVESWNRSVTVNDITINWNFAGAPTAAVFHVTGGSYGTFIDGLVVRNAGSIVLSGAGSQTGDVSFGRVVVEGDAKFIPLSAIADLTWRGVRYAGVQTKTVTVSLAANWWDHGLELVTGTVKSLKVAVTTTQGLVAFYVTSTEGQGVEASGQLVAGKSVQLAVGGYLGSDYLFNREAAKYLHIYTNGAMPAGATAVVTVEYYAQAATY